MTTKQDVIAIMAATIYARNFVVSAIVVHHDVDDCIDVASVIYNRVHESEKLLP